MKQLKKTLLTLVALLAVTTGAWADDVITVTWNSGGSYENNNSRDGVTLSGDIVQYSSGEWQLAYANKSGTFTTELGNFTSIVITGGWIKNDAFSGEGWSGRTWTGNASSVPFSGYLTSDNGDAPWTITFTIEPAPAGTAVTFTRGTGDKANEWTMDGGMPAGNVTVSVLYYDLATLATDAVTAATEAAANTDAELVTVADNAATGGTLMYYVTTDANFTQAQAIALAETAWSEDVPTADGFNFDTATDVYVWYYLKGDAEHSDTDPVCVAVTLLPEPTYNVEFAEGTPEPDKWSADPNTGVKKGQTVTVSYSGQRKVIGVKAEKKSNASAESFATDDYNEASWDGSKVVFTKKQAATTPTAVEDASGNVTWNQGWYTVAGDVTINGNVSLKKDTYLILQDGATLTINGRIVGYYNDDDEDEGYNLYIYGQAVGDGKLNVNHNYTSAAIYGSKEGSEGIEIHGVEVTATNTGRYPSSVGLSAGNIKMYGGKLTATAIGNDNGGSYNGGDAIGFSSNFEVYDGEVEATATNEQKCRWGISSTYGTLTVYGGKVKATGSGVTENSTYGSAIYGNIQSGTDTIKFYFSDNGTTWNSGAVYSNATTAPSDRRYIKAE